jgi:signal transduction histidine kinase
LNKLISYFLYDKSKGSFIVRELAKVLGIGVLSILLGKIKFLMPGMESRSTDLREIALIIGIFYFRHWIPVILVSFITSLGIPEGYSVLSAFITHAISLLIVFYIYNYFNKIIKNHVYLSIIWIFVIFFYYIVFLEPLIIIVHYYLGLTLPNNNILITCIESLKILRFEIVTTALITSLYLLNHNINKLLKQQNEELRISKNRAEDSDRLKSSFLQNLSHELRTPMNGIIGFSQLIEMSEPKNEQLREYTKLISISSNRLLLIVDNIVEASEIETNQIKLNVSPVSVKELFDELLDNLKNSGCETQRIIFTGKNDSIIIADIKKLKRVLYHLIDNALKFSTDKNIEVQYYINDNSFSFSIADRGIGIEDENKEKIFKRFMQLENKSVSEGNGLGLFIAKGYVEFLNGKIWLKSVKNKGTTFYVTIPVKTKLVKNNTFFNCFIVI